METAKSIDRAECWERLAQQALKQGNHKVRLLFKLNIHLLNVSPDRRESLPADEKFRQIIFLVSCNRQHGQIIENAENC